MVIFHFIISQDVNSRDEGHYSITLEFFDFPIACQEAVIFAENSGTFTQVFKIQNS
jgi:hypothetical protein